MQTTTHQQHYSHNFSDDSDKAFFYVDGIPTKGIWIDLGSIDGWADVYEALTGAGVTTVDYGGDILVADVEGALPNACYSPRFDLIDLQGYLTLRDDLERMNVSSEAVVAFINWFGCWDSDAFGNAFSGRYDSRETFAEQYLDDAGILYQVPEHLQRYFDIEAFARDLFITDFYFDEGFVFSCHC